MESNKEQKLVSVIVPVYNILDCLERCVASLLAQTYQKIEILLVDDGSTDGTGDLCDQLAGKDNRIRVFHKENGGSSSARNYGIRQAKGEYLGFVDSDDFVEPDMYERLLEVLLQHQGMMAQVGRNEIDVEGNLLPDICVPPEKLEALFTGTIDASGGLLFLYETDSPRTFLPKECGTSTFPGGRVK